MALFKSTILAQISGSINGITFAHNSGGAYARNRSLPTNPGTDRQDQVRTAMAAISQAYRDSLTNTQRELWINYGANTQVVNRIGDTIRLSGIAAFNRVNLFRMSSLGLPMTLDPPDPTGNPEPAPSFLSVSMDGQIGQPPDLVISLTGNPDSAYGLVVYYSGPLSPGRSYYRGPYITHVDEVAGSPNMPVTLTQLGPVENLQNRKIAARIVLYDMASLMPVWDVFVDPVPVPTVP